MSVPVCFRFGVAPFEVQIPYYGISVVLSIPLRSDLRFRVVWIVALCELERLTAHQIVNVHELCFDPRTILVSRIGSECAHFYNRAGNASAKFKDFFAEFFELES